MKFLLSLIIASVLFCGVHAQESVRVSANVTPATTTETSDLKVFPNPCKRDFNIKTHTNSPTGIVELYVINILGQPVYKETIQADRDGNIEKLVDVNKQLPEGYYFIKIDDAYTKYEIVRLRID